MTMPALFAGAMGGGVAPYVFNHTISSTTTTPFNLRAAAVAAGWDQVKPLAATVTINGGVNQQSNALATPAFDTGNTFPVGTTLSLINNGTITGFAGTAGLNGLGGTGGLGGVGSGGVGTVGNPGGNGSNGGTGGDALKAQYPISVTNNGSVIGGPGGPGGLGGGGGGGGGDASYENEDWASGGNGGRGQGRDGAATSGQFPGSGVKTGGNGGPYSTAGQASGSSRAGGSAGAAGSAGARGNYINGNAYVNWVATGTRTGSAI